MAEKEYKRKASVQYLPPLCS